MVLGRVQPSGGAWCLGCGEGRAEGALHSWDFFLLQEGMQGIYPHPKYRDMGLSCPGSFPGTYFCSLWEGLEVLSAVILLAPVLLSLSITSYSSRCA